MTTARVPSGQARMAKSGRIAVRASDEQRALIALASVEAKTTVSDFVLTATLARAHDVLAERRVFTVAQEEWEAFVALLDQPTTEKPRLRRLLTELSVLDV